MKHTMQGVKAAAELASAIFQLQGWTWDGDVPDADEIEAVYRSLMDASDDGGWIGTGRLTVHRSDSETGRPTYEFFVDVGEEAA